MNKMIKKIDKLAYHRNGVGGNPFCVIIFTDRERDKMLAVVFPERDSCAVFNLEQLAKDEIEFGLNSWRGDMYEPELRQAIEKDIPDFTPCNEEL